MNSRGVSNVRNAVVILCVLTIIIFGLSLFFMFPIDSDSIMILVSLAIQIGMIAFIFYGLKRVTDEFEEKWGTVFMIIGIVLILFRILTFDGHYFYTIAYIVSYIYLIIGGNQIRNLD